jgi:hypothetical protein
VSSANAAHKLRELSELSGLRKISQLSEFSCHYKREARPATGLDADFSSCSQFRSEITKENLG